MRIEATAPGKVILIGEHSAVYGRPAVVAAVDRRMSVVLETLGAGEGDAIAIELPDLGSSVLSSWPEVRAAAREARAAWQAYDRAPDARSLARVGARGPAGLALLAVGEAVDGEAAGSDLPGFRLRAHADLPVGAGFGSSAALAVAVVTAVRELAGLPTGAADVFGPALEVERRQHGRPSGVDVAAAAHGGVLRVDRTASGPRWRPLEPPDRLLRRFGIWLTGAPGESTGAVVTEVGERLAADPGRRDRLLGAMTGATEELTAVLEDDAADPAAPLAPLRAFQACLEELGVVPQRVRALIREVEAAGGAAKVSGAGSLSGPGAGALLVYHPEASFDLPGLADLPRVDARLGAPGSDRRRTP